MNDYIEHLKKFGLKNTTQRQQVYDVLADSKYPMSATDIHKSLNNVDLATVHRTLNTFVGIDLIEWNNFSDEGKKFSLKIKGHSHIITCKNCGKTAVFHICFIENFEKHILKKTGFKVLEHQLQFLGLCSSCRSK